MGAKRRKIQLELAFMAEGRGEAPMAADKGPEASKAKRKPEDPALPGPFFIGRTGNSLTSRTAVVRTRMPGGVTGKAREGIPMSIMSPAKEGACQMRAKF